MVDFTQISDIIHKHFDIDLMDIKRNGIEIYSNIPCNIEIKQEDNPDPLTVDVVPIISSLEIHMPTYVDIQNNDYIIAKRMSPNNEVMEVYRGVCGYPSVWQARKSITMAMNTLNNDGEVTPPNPIEKSEVIINYTDENNETIKAQATKYAEKNKPFDLYPPQIRGFEFVSAFLDDVLQPTAFIHIDNAVNDVYNALFEYKSSDVNKFFRVLVNGPYTKNNGEVAFGYHLYKEMKLVAITGENGNYVITTEIKDFIHEDNGQVKIGFNTVLKLFNSNVWVKIISEPTQVLDGYKFETEPYIPSEQEKNAYVCDWYGGIE